MCRGRGAVVFCPGGRLVFQRSWGGSESEEPAERNLASVSCHRWLLSESALINVWNLSRGRSIVGSSGVDIGDGSDPDSLASQTTRLSSVLSSSSAASESSRVGTSPVGDSDSRRRRAWVGQRRTRRGVMR